MSVSASRTAARRLVLGALVAAVLAVTTQAGAQDKKKAEKAKAAPAGKSLGSVTCDKAKFAIQGVAAAYDAKKSWVLVMFFTTSTSEDERKWLLAQGLNLRDASGKILQPQDVGVTGDILKDFKRQNEVRGAMPMRFDIRAVKPPFGATLDLAQLEKGVNNQVAFHCGNNVNAYVARGPGFIGAPPASGDFSAFKAEVKGGGKGSLASKADVKPDPANKSAAQIPLAWDVKADFTVYTFQ